MIPACFAAHARLLQEPWGMTPADVAGLTTQQVTELYLRPAVERAEEMRRQSAGGGRRDRLAHQEPTWEWFLATWGGHYRGVSLTDLRAKFDTLHAAWAAEYRKGG